MTDSRDVASRSPAMKDTDQRSRNRGFFVSFEGAESSGKSTQTALLVAWLREQGFGVLQTREPGGTSVGEGVRDILLAHASKMSAQTEALLFESARTELVDSVILPALCEGKVVVCDRYIDSSLAYQGYGLGLPIEEILAVNRWAVCRAMPDVTILLGHGRELAASGTVEGPDRIESRGGDFHRRVRMGYLQIASRDRNRVVVVDTAQGIEATAKEIRSIIARRLRAKIGYDQSTE